MDITLGQAAGSQIAWEGSNVSRYRDHNIRQIKGALLRTEGSQKGTAPSTFNIESDKGKPGPVSPMSTKGYDHLDAVVRSTDNQHVKPEDASNITLSGRKIALALAHVRRTRFDYYRAVLKVENDPGAVKRWQDGRGEDAERWLYSWEKACEEAADFVGHVWPGTRLYVPNQMEEPVETTAKGAVMDRSARQKAQQAETHRRRYLQLREIEENEGMGRREAKMTWAARNGYSIPTIDRAEEWAQGAGLEEDGAA